MRNIYKIRRDNARTLVAEAGNQTRFGERIDIGKKQASHIVGKTMVRIIGDDLAERIEQSFKRPADWLDTDHSDPLLEVVRKLTGPRRAALLEVAKGLLAEQRKK